MKEAGMRLRTEDLMEGAFAFQFEEKHTAMPVLVEMVADGECEILTPIRVKGNALQVQQMIEISGAVELRARLTCSRCLNPFEIGLRNTFALNFTRTPPAMETAPGPKEVEMRPEMVGLVVFEGDEIDLRDAVQEQVVLALPQKPLCSENCRGLCPVCGFELNQGDCGCRPAAVNSGFAVLKNLKLPPAR
jgi:uncharacterized protein